MRVAIGLLLFIVGTAPAALGQIIWRGDFETGDLSQWTYLTNPVGLSVENTCVYQGDWAGRSSITGADKFLWHGDPALNRSEFSYQPPTTAEGADTYLGWSFYLPKPLLPIPHEIGYWESDKSWHQKMRFNIVGTSFSFQRSNADHPFWTRKDFATAGVWHDVAMHVHWSLDPKLGAVTVWLDGERIGTEHFATRVNKTDPLFVQMGILRHRVDARETIYIDNVRQGTDMASVLAGFSADEPVRCP